jgi:enoyl-CoA hydratase
MIDGDVRRGVELVPEELVHLEMTNAIATITLDSPHNRNALSAALVAQLREHLDAAGRDSTVRAVVLTHSGPAFCSGADLSEMTHGDPAVSTRNMFGAMRAIVDAPKPVLAQLTGSARAGGIGLVGACDIALASPDVTFAFTEVRLGLAPAMISLTTRTRLSERSASRYYLTGETFDAAEAARIGLLTEAVIDVEVTLAGYLDALRQCSPQGLEATKSISASPLRSLLANEGAAMTELSAKLFASEEAAEGMRAFRERRNPRWAR